MSTRQLLLTLPLAALAELTLLGVFVFLAEPRLVGGAVPHIRIVDAAYFAVPLVLAAAAAVTPVRVYLRRRRLE